MLKQKIHKQGMRFAIKKRKADTLTKVRFLIAMKQRNLNVPGRLEVVNRIFISELSWQKKIEWAKRIIDYTGKKGENIEWLTLVHNSREKALELLEAKSDRLKGENNPWFNHGGKMSPFSKDSVNYDPSLSKRVNDKLNETGNRSNRIEYHLNKGLGLCQAVSALKERQAVGRLDKFIERYGEEEGKKRWVERQEKWMKSFKKTPFSKISQELFDAIMKEGHEGNVYYATYDRIEMIGKINKEFTLKLKEKVIKPDFIDTDSKCVIEFDGDYWHSENVANKSRERERDDALIDAGYKLMRVKEYDFKRDRQGTIEKCKNFLKQSKENSSTQ